jgi:maleate isomerase
MTQQQASEHGDPYLDLGVLPSRLDEGIAARAAIGLIVLASDQTMEHEFRRIVRQDGVALYESRIFNDNAVTPETLRAMRERIAPAADLILPGMPLDVVAFGCTSAAMELGEEVVFEEIRKVRPAAKCTTPITAALAALEALEVRRVAVLTPYSPDINRTVRAYICARGLEVPAMATFDRPDDREAARISVESIQEAVKTLAAEDNVDGVFVSCTSLRLTDVAREIEAEVGKPVTSSDHALAWHCLRLAGVDEAMPQFGRLYELPLPT